MAICQIMISDFLHKTGRLEPVLKKWMYSNRDLRVGIEYCQDLKLLGYKKEPFHKYNLDEFIKWGESKLPNHTKR